MRARPKDLSLGGICVVLAEQAQAGRVGVVALETMHEGNVVHFTASAKVVYSILSGSEGFRTGLQFTDIDAENNKMLASIMI